MGRNEQIPGHALWALAGALLATGEAKTVKRALELALAKLYELDIAVEFEVAANEERLRREAVQMVAEDVLAPIVATHRASPR